MQRRVAVISIVLLLLASFSYAQVARLDVNRDDQATTNFTSVAAFGYDATGNAGYLELVGPDGNGAPIYYYLWVAPAGDLLIASRPTMTNGTNGASFPTGDWRNISDSVRVGSQS